MGGAEFYPVCVQVNIGGNGNGMPQDTVSFPGAYADDDPGIYDPSVLHYTKFIDRAWSNTQSLRSMTRARTTPSQEVPSRT